VRVFEATLPYLLKTRCTLADGEEKFKFNP